MAEHYYLYSERKDDIELDRLRLQQQIYDPITIRHFENIGVSESWQCLEVGAGVGSMTQWLSKRVGPTGKVVATDIDMRFLSEIRFPNVEIRQHDILKDDLEEGRYDLAHCRCLLLHLSDPEKALKKMSRALRTGGYLLIEETDYGSVLATDITNPSATEFVSSYRTGIDILRKKGFLDPYFGRRVRELLEGLGLVNIGHEGWTLVNRGGDPFALLNMMTVQAASKPILASGIFSLEQFETFQRQFLDPNFYYIGLTLFAAWGKEQFNELRRG
jgi:ubiquinone/menaquinone biosynthesis C-methylase UbiE